MPELPEVETIARYLREGGRDIISIPGKTISHVQVYWARSIAEPSVESFSERVKLQQVQCVSRRGKFLQIHLTKDTLLIHLRMSGDIRVENTLQPIQTHDRVLICFLDGDRLAFNDPRKFGRIWLLSKAEPLLGKLGPEPLDEFITPEKFHQMLQSKKRQLKPLLLDQIFIAGLGNIYTDESLFLAGLHPLRISYSLDLAEAEKLLFSIRKVLRAGIDAQGASIDWVYRGGDFQNTFKVYQRTGDPCAICGQVIERILVGQRGTHYCPNCQRAE